MKKIVSIILTLVMVLPCFCITGIQAEEENYVVSGEGRLPFEDIPAEATWYTPYLEFCYSNGIIKGQGNEYTFAPNVELSRATFVVMLARVMNADLENWEYKGTFKDCAEGTWYTASVEWAAEKEYVIGALDGTVFMPDATMNREQGAAMLTRMICSMFEGSKIEDGSGSLSEYADKDKVSTWAVEYVEYIIFKKIMTSTSVSEKKFEPKTAMTRAQAVVLFNNVIVGVLNSDCEHEYTEASCTKGKTCNICGLVFSLPNGHKCENLSCEEGGICVTCGEDVAPDSSLHKFTIATCTEPKTCTVCGLTEGTALGHTTDFGICTRCNGEMFESSYHRAAYYMVKNCADSTGNGEYIAYDYLEVGDGEYEIGMLYYDASNFEFSIAYFYYFPDGTCLVSGIQMPYGASTYLYEIGYFDADMNEISTAEGSLDPTKAKPGNVPYTVSSHSGSNEYWSWMDSNTPAMLEGAINHINFILYDICGEGLETFNFTNYKFQLEL